MEEFRDERLGKIMSWMQAWARGYLSRKGFKKLQEQRVALKVVQRNLRKYLQLRTWPWYKLWQKVKPLLNVSRIEDEIAVSIARQLTQPIWPDIVCRYIILYTIYISAYIVCLLVLWFELGGTVAAGNQAQPWHVHSCIVGRNWTNDSSCSTLRFIYI